VVETPRPVGPDNCRGDNKFTCVDGTVICDVERCDGNRDCPQGDDEDDCPGIVDTTLTSSSMITDPTTTTTTTFARKIFYSNITTAIVFKSQITRFNYVYILCNT
jgi:hypothetical protein